MDKLRNTVPFIGHTIQEPTISCILFDKLELPLSTKLDGNLLKKISGSLRLKKHTYTRSENAIALVMAQYDACLEFIYSNPIWEMFRTSESERLYTTYLLESRHYLAAAAYRMSCGVRFELINSHLNTIIAEHVTEEADHNKFFERALDNIGCSRDAVKHSRPLPTTIEWINLMRTVSSYDPLCAALCSGLLEHTAQNRETVKDWHTMLIVEKNLVAESVNAIYDHVKIDIMLGHGENWKEALTSEGELSTDRLAVCLNAISLVAEMIYRWLNSLYQGYGSFIVKNLQQSTSLLHENKKKDSTDSYINGLPVWPANIIDELVYGNDDRTDNLKDIISVAYSIDHLNLKNDTDKAKAHAITARDFSKKVSVSNIDFDSSLQLKNMCKSWTHAINGHLLWETMLSQPTYALTCGWLLENFHYISAIAQHTASAIASCHDEKIRVHLVKHLREEIHHGNILGEALRTSKYGDLTVNYRPLPTTISFIGALSMLAKTNWKSYCLALSYLQLSMPDNMKTASNIDNFYAIISKNAPECTPLLEAMQAHDEIDDALAHESDTLDLLDALYQHSTILTADVEMASLIPQLSWGFLDGIVKHYRHGNIAIFQRIGWHVC